jgi:predicted phosphodiesterase
MHKIALLSDVHGNLPALQVVLDDIDRWNPDTVIVNGDVVNRGPQPRECWELISARLDTGWLMTIGNHEQYVLEWAAPRPHLSEIDREFFASSLWTRELLTENQIERIRQLPLACSLEVGGKLVRATHASLRGTRDGIVPWTEDAVIIEKMAPAPDVFVTSHTHRIFHARINGTLVINTGAVGVPLDGNVRAGYVRLVWDAKWGFSAELIRLTYDRAETERQYKLTHYTETNGASAPLLYAEWRDARSCVPDFFAQYGDIVRAGDLTPHEAVARYLNDRI